MKKINAIIFDLGGVIFNIDYKLTIDNFKKIGIKDASIFYSKRQQNQIFDKLECGVISEKIFIDELMKFTKTKNKKDIEYSWNAMLLNLPLNRINYLKKINKNYRIFLLSNTNIIHVNKIKRDMGGGNWKEFNELFEKVYLSYKIGVRKPSAEAFNIILKENKLIANNVLFIDDSIQHIISAKRIGIKTYHLQDDEDIINLKIESIQ